MTLTAFIATWMVCLLAAISPGPAVLMAARVGLTEGFRTGLALAAGIGMGAVTWALAALFGLSLLFEYAPVLLMVFKIGGALFLIWIAINMWRHADEPIAEPDPNATPQSTWAAFRLGLVTQFSNPKPAIFFGAVFVGMIPAETSNWTLGALLACIFLSETIWNALVARLFSLEKTRRFYMTVKHLIDRAFGGILAILSIKIAAS